MDQIIRDMIEDRSSEDGVLDKRVIHEVLQQVVLDCIDPVFSKKQYSTAVPA